MFNRYLFDFPKPVEIIKQLISQVSNTDDTILDFFSGSATTAHAVMQLNAEDGGNRRFILVQIPELCDEKSEAYKAGYKNICEIGKERIRRAGKKILEEHIQVTMDEDKSPLDVGFRVFKLDTSNLKTWDATPIEDEQLDLLYQRMNSMIHRVKPERTDLDILKRLEKTNLNLDELDYLAKRLDSFDNGEAAQFQGMACKLGVSNIKDFINLTFCCQQATQTTLVDHAADYHAGTVLSPIPLKHEGTASRRVNGTFYLLGEELTLEQFCEEHDLAYPQDNREFVLRPASLDEAGLFYSEEKLDEALGTVGHLRMDFGHGEKEFWHTWWPHNEDRFNTPEFKEVLQRFVDDLRQTGLLKNLGAMDAYCWQHGGSITEDRRSYGYIAETENYRFCLRCTPFPGEYQGYLYCYDLCQQEMYRQEHPVVGRVTFASGEQQEFTDSTALLQAIREELPFRSTTGFRFETLTDDPEVKKAVDDILLDFAGEDNSRRTCNYGLTETGKQALRKETVK